MSDARSRRARPSFGSIADLVLRVLASVALASLAVTAWHDVSKAWDVWAYHLPFAARIVGLVHPSAYAFGRANEARFEGFPLLAETLQGIFWRVTGRPECASFVALLSLPAIAIFLRRLFHVPPHLTIVALLGVPLVQTHAAACYIDLPANACAAALILLVQRAVTRREAPSLGTLLGAGALAAATANMKFQLVPVAVAAAVVLAAVALARAETPRRRARTLLVVLAIAPIVFATPIKNVVVHGNPVWPVELHALGHDFPHAETAYASSPPWLEHAPRPVRFACSALEIGLRPIASHARWSIDQWTPPSEDGYRMGGFFGGYVALNLAALAFAALRRRTRESLAAAAFVAGTTAIVSVMPQSHELRYYLVWMIVLVSENLLLWASEPRSAAAGIAGLAGAAAFAIVLWSTEGDYVVPSGDSFRALVAAKVDRRALDGVRPGERVCVSHEPWTFLYAPRFHPEKRYTVQAAEEPAECEGARLLP